MSSKKTLAEVQKLAAQLPPEQKAYLLLEIYKVQVNQEFVPPDYASDSARVSSETSEPAEVTTPEMKVRLEFEKVINRNSLENESDTPDFILADMLYECLMAYNRAATRSREWKGESEYHPGSTQKAIDPTGDMNYAEAFDVLRFHIRNDPKKSLVMRPLLIDALKDITIKRDGTFRVLPAIDMMAIEAFATEVADAFLTRWLEL